MAFVLPIFTTRSFSKQKREKQDNKDCSSAGDGAISTKSSANANINNCKVAMVY